MPIFNLALWNCTEKNKLIFCSQIALNAVMKVPNCVVEKAYMVLAHAKTDIMGSNVILVSPENAISTKIQDRYSK